MVFGSPLLDENGDMNGTWLVLLAETKADVEAFCAGDPFSAADLFDTTEIRQLAPGFDRTPKVEGLQARLG